MLHRWKKCSDILKVASVGGGEIAHFQLKTIVQTGVCQVVKRWYSNRVMDQNIRKLLIFAVFAS